MIIVKKYDSLADSKQEEAVYKKGWDHGSGKKWT